MSDDATKDTSNTDGNNTTSGDTSAAGDEFQPITTQEELNKLLGERAKRERGKFSDYGDLKAKAAKLDEIEAANQTEAEKAQARIKALEDELATVQRDSLRRKIAGEHGITDQDDIDLFLTGTDEETLTKQAERLAARAEEAGKPRRPQPDRNQGRSSGGGTSTADQFAAAIQSAL